MTPTDITLVTCRFCTADNTVVRAGQFTDIEPESRSNEGDPDYDDEIWWDHLGVCPECQKR